MMMGGIFFWWIIPAAVLATAIWIIARRVRTQRVEPANQPAMPRDANADETRIFRLAMRENGKLTVSDVVVQLGITAQEAENILSRICDGVRVRMDVSNNGVVTYDFVELQLKKALPDESKRDD